MQEPEDTTLVYVTKEFPQKKYSKINRPFRKIWEAPVVHLPTGFSRPHSLLAGHANNHHYFDKLADCICFVIRYFHQYVWIISLL